MNRISVLLAAALCLAIVACGTEAPAVPGRPSPTATIGSANPTGPRTVTDMTGRAVSVPETVRSVVALSPSAADFAVSLGLEVLGRTTDTPESAAPGAKPVGSAISPDFNAIAALKPDLVIADAAYQAGRTRDFDRFAYPVFMLKAGSYVEVLAALTALGAATGHPEEAATTRAALEERATKAAQAARTHATSPTVLILTGGGRDVFGGSTATYLGNLVQVLGATNVLGAVADGGPIPGFGVVDVAQSAVLNPDVVLILPSGQGGLAAQIRAEKAWTNTPALRQNRIHDLDTALFLRSPGPRVGEALEVLLALLWP
ncbi:MAG: ABC transporter substrate-binding protein [bacterium]